MINLMQGDCLDRMKEIEDGSVDLVLTDPPYGTTACKWDSVIPFGPMWDSVWRLLKPNGVAVFTASQPFTSALVMSGINNFKYSLVWDKVNRFTGHLNAKIMPMRSHEDVLIFYRRSPTYRPILRKGVPYSCTPADLQSVQNYGKHSKLAYVSDGTNASPGSVIKVKGQFGPNVSVHPTQKPVALMEYLIRTYTNEGETVLDFTMGSGTTGVACVNTGRNFIGIERDETYFNIAKERIDSAIEEEKWKLI